MAIFINFSSPSIFIVIIWIFIRMPRIFVGSGNKSVIKETVIFQ